MIEPRLEPPALTKEEERANDLLYRLDELCRETVKTEEHLTTLNKEIEEIQGVLEERGYTICFI